MAFLLGIDTGGTYTDAVILQDETRVIATAKSLTTRHDLAQGIGAAAQAVLDSSGIAPDQIAMASLSTTLATNALVEGQGGKVALVFIGFRDGDLENMVCLLLWRGMRCCSWRGVTTTRVLKSPH